MIEAGAAGSGGAPEARQTFRRFDMTDARVPVLLLTGFLGSGKTTVLNKWLGQAALANAAVIVNEFGEIGIDNELIAKSDDRTIELTTGCLCCTVQGTLVETLQDLMIRRRRGDIKNFDSVVIETTGLADPVPVIQALITAPVTTEYRLSRVVTTVEAPQGIHTIDHHEEARRQVMVANDILITKADLSQEPIETVEAELARMNPAATIHRSKPDSIPFPLAGAVQEFGELTAENAEDWLRAAKVSSHGHKHDDGHGRHHRGHDHHQHHHHDDDAIGTFVLTFDEPLEWQEVAAWLDALVIAHGHDMLRIKGILQIKGRSEPIVVQAVQRLFHPPNALDAWPGGTRQSRVVFITNGIQAKFVREVFDVIRGRSKTKKELTA
jgi:G3E family GTPase